MGVVAAVVICLGYGSCIALDAGVRKPSSWPVLFGLVLAVGVLALVAEGVSTMAFETPSSPKPRWWNAVRMLLWLTLFPIVGAIYWLLSTM